MRGGKREAKEVGRGIREARESEGGKRKQEGRGEKRSNGGEGATKGKEQRRGRSKAGRAVRITEEERGKEREREGKRGPKGSRIKEGGVIRFEMGTMLQFGVFYRENHAIFVQFMHKKNAHPFHWS